MALQRYEGTSWVDAGLSRRSMSIEGCLDSGAPMAATTGTTEQVLATINIPNKVMNNNGDCLILNVFGQGAATANNKQIRIRKDSISGTILADTGAVAANAAAGYCELYIFRTAAAQLNCLSYSQFGSTLATLVNQLAVSASTGLPVLVITGTSPTAAGDLTLTAWRLLVGREGGVQSAGGVLL